MSWPARTLLVFAGLILAWMVAAWVWGGWTAIRQWYVRTVLGKQPQPPPPTDGFGQTLAQDLLYWKRFVACRKQSVTWRKPSPEEQKTCDSHPIMGRFGDFTNAVAEVDGRRWVVRERLWHGWPDPPEWVFFALEGEDVWSGADFDVWPRRWARPV